MAETNEMMATLQDVVAKLNDLGTPYMITGSVAMSAYATARTTMDIDVIVEIGPSEATRFAHAFQETYYVDANSITRAQQYRSMFNVLNLETGIKVDFIPRKPTDFENAKFERRRSSKIGDITFWVIGKEDLILSKLEWAKDSHSEMQFRDIRNLIESGADETFLMKMVGENGLKGVWEAFEKWKIQAAK